MEDEGPCLRPAQPAVERDQLLEGTALLEIGVVEAPDHDVRHVREAVRPQEMTGRVRRERRQRILALHGSLGEVMRAGRAERDRAAFGRADEQPADVRVLAKRREEARVPLVELLERQAARLVHERDETEVARAEHDRLPVGDVVLGALLRLDASRRLADREPDHGVLLVAAGDLSHASALEGALDELVQPVAVPLLEGRALRLPVVGEDDDLVRARRVAARAIDPAELLVELAEGLQRVGALEPRVMGDLVVAREGRVHRGPAAHHVGEDAVDDQVADDHAHRAAHERIETAPMPPGAHVTADRAQRGRPFEQHLPGEEDEGPRDVEPVGEERAVPRVRPLLGVHPADRQDDLVGLAREQVAAARAAVGEETDARRPLALDARAVGGSRARGEQAGLLVHPAKRRDVVVRAEQDSRLARPRLRGEIRLPLGEPVRPLGDPARHGGGVAVPHRPAEDREREPVDLEVDDPRHVGPVRATLAAGDSLDDLERVRVVVVRPEDRLEDDAHGGDDERREERPAEAVHDEGVLEDVRRELQHERVHSQDQQKAEGQHEGQPKRGDERREDRVQHRDHGGDREGPARLHDVDAGQDRRGHPERRSRERPGDEQPERLEARTLGLPAEAVAVGGRIAQSASFAALFSARFSARCSFCSATLAFASTYAPPTSTLPPV